MLSLSKSQQSCIFKNGKYLSAFYQNLQGRITSTLPWKESGCSKLLISKLIVRPTGKKSTFHCGLNTECRPRNRSEVQKWVFKYMVKQFREEERGCPAKAAREAGCPHVKVNKGWSNPYINTTHKTYLRISLGLNVKLNILKLLEKAV